MDLLIQIILLVSVPALLLLATVILYPLVTPTIETAGEVSMGDKTPADLGACVLAGSMDPPHLGHIALIRHLLRRGHRRVLVVIGVNPTKRYAVDPERRAALLRTMCATLGLEGVVVHAVEGYVWRWARKHAVRTLFRGIRSWAKDGREERMLHLLNQAGPVLLGPLRRPIPTVFLQADPAFAHISSTLVRERCKECGQAAGAAEALADLVPRGAEGEVWRLYHRGV